MSSLRGLIWDGKILTPMLSEILRERYGCKIDQASSGEEVLERFRSSTKPYNFVILKYVPEREKMDGIKTMEQMRAVEKETRLTPATLCLHTFAEPNEVMREELRKVNAVYISKTKTSESFNQLDEIMKKLQAA